MSAERLVDRLSSRPSPTVATLPDGSVDRYCRLSAGGLEPVERRETFAREVGAGGRKGFALTSTSTEPGGQSVNAATQAHVLGGDVTCYGHLDHAVFAGLPFETVSMGRPARVDVLDLLDGDLLLIEDSHDLDEWTLDDLEAVASPASLFGGDALCWTNWVSIPGIEAAFHTLGRADLPRIPLVFDPGDVLGYDVAAHRRLREAVTAMQATADVVLSLNGTELRAMAAALPDPPTPPVTDHDRLRAIRAVLGSTAVVKHAADEAAAATESGLLAVDAEHLANPVRQTGGGDRFSGALAFALGAGWSWEPALQCANEAGTHYVATGETAGIDEILDRVTEN